MRRVIHFLTLLSRLCLVLAPLSWLLPWLTVGEASEETSGISLLFVFGGLVFALPGYLRFLWFGPPLVARPRLRAGRQLEVHHLWRRTSPYLALFVGMALLFYLPDGTSGSGSGAAALMLLCAGATLVIPAIQRYDPARDRAVLAAQMACLLRMGIPLSEGLDKLAEDARSRLRTRFQGLPQTLHMVSQDLQAGAQLSYAVSCHAYFPTYWVSFTTLGERSETLADELERLSLLEQQRAATPPLLRLVLTFIAVMLLGLFLDTYIRATFVRVMEPVTGAHFGLWEAASWLTRLSLLGFLLAALQRSLGGNPRRRLFHNLADGIRLRLPLWGPALRVEQQTLAVLALLAGARQHRSLADMLSLANETVSLPPYKSLLDPSRALAGASLADCLSRPAGLFAPEVVWLVRQGEDTGQLVGALELAVTHLDELRKDWHRRLDLGVDVGLQLFMGLLVALYVFGFWVPMLDYYRAVLEEAPL